MGQGSCLFLLQPSTDVDALMQQQSDTHAKAIHEKKIKKIKFLAKKYTKKVKKSQKIEKPYFYSPVGRGTEDFSSPEFDARRKEREDDSAWLQLLSSEFHKTHSNVTNLKKSLLTPLPSDFDQ
eukprot:TRINITY_DN12052_c0_g1_i1.p1 TRINITY_DN12052_c0_g1~~TRINITY_DN12052_c0_g1_i1.p1  ORF type:complete len:140 (-),score=43.33 TRINITY_DN12052_c0_g1_i1:112-480(-)